MQIIVPLMHETRSDISSARWFTPMTGSVIRLRSVLQGGFTCCVYFFGLSMGMKMDLTEMRLKLKVDRFRAGRISGCRSCSSRWDIPGLIPTTLSGLWYLELCCNIFEILEVCSFIFQGLLEDLKKQLSEISPRRSLITDE